MLYGIDFVRMEQVRSCDAVILAVAHQAFAGLTKEDFDGMFASADANKRVLLDLKGTCSILRGPALELKAKRSSSRK